MKVTLDIPDGEYALVSRADLQRLERLLKDQGVWKLFRILNLNFYKVTPDEEVISMRAAKVTKAQARILHAIADPEQPAVVYRGKTKLSGSQGINYKSLQVLVRDGLVEVQPRTIIPANQNGPIRVKEPLVVLEDGDVYDLTVIGQRVESALSK